MKFFNVSEGGVALEQLAQGDSGLPALELSKTRLDGTLSDQV